MVNVIFGILKMFNFKWSDKVFCVFLWGNFYILWWIDECLIVNERFIVCICNKKIFFFLLIYLYVFGDLRILC